MKTWFLSLTRARQIVCAVLTLHVLCVLLLLINHVWTTKRLTHTFTVHTVRLTPTLPQPPAVATASTPRPAAVVSGQSPTKKPSVTKKTTPAPKIKPSPKPVIPKPSLTVPVLSLPTPTPILSTPTTTPFSPTETISTFLRDCLELPEFGEVKLRLTLDKSGRLIDLEILEAKSEKNAQFLKNRLPELEFPWLNENTTVTIVFRNV